jgi:hypothetical protein
MPTVLGTVKSVSGDSFTVTAQDGTNITVEVNKATTYFDVGVSSPTISDVTVGQHVAVFGTEGSDSITATKVAIGTPAFGGRSGPSPKGDALQPPTGRSGPPSGPPPTMTTLGS